MLSLLSDDSGDSVPDDIPSFFDAKPIQRPSSPALPMDYAFDRDFSKQLNRKLQLVLLSQQVRRRIYGIHVADNYPISHTPPEVKEKYHGGQQSVLQDPEAPTPEEEMEQEPAGAYRAIMVEPPSPESPTATCWKDNAVKLAPKPFIHTPNTPPSSSEDEVAKTPPARGSSKKRSFAHVIDQKSEHGSCRQRRRILSITRVSTGVR